MTNEDADPARTDKQTDDDQDDAPEELPAKQGENAGDDQYNCQNPKNQFQAPEIPSVRLRKYLQ